MGRGNFDGRFLVGVFGWGLGVGMDRGFAVMGGGGVGVTSACFFHWSERVLI